MNQYANTSNQIQRLMDKQDDLIKLTRELNDYQQLLCLRQTELLRLISETSINSPSEPPPQLEIPRPLRNRVSSTTTSAQAPLDYFIYTFLPDRNARPAGQSTTNQNTLTSNIIDTLLDEFLNPVDVPPTPEQIVNATTELSYGDIEEPLNTSCPISLISFEDNDTILMINRCRHIYNKTSLLNWFQTNPKCPLCRVDVRETE